MEITNMVVSGLVGATSVWLARDAIIPTAAGMLSKSAKLHKNWNYKDSETGNPVGTIEIKQLGSKVHVIATRSLSRDGQSIKRVFTYKGAIVGRDLVLNFEQKGARGAVSGALVLRLNSTLQEMSGATQYYSDSAGKVISLPIFFSAIV